MELYPSNDLFRRVRNYELLSIDNHDIINLSYEIERILNKKITPLTSKVKYLVK